MATEQLDIEEIVEAIQKLAQTVSPEDGFAVIMENTILMTEEADRVITAMADYEEKEGNPALGELLRNRREFIQAVKPQAHPQIITEIQSALEKLVRVSSPEEGITVIEENPILLTQETDRIFEFMIENAESTREDDVATALRNWQALLRNIRESEKGTNDDDSSEIQSAFQALMDASNIEELTNAVVEHPELQSEKADAMFEMMLNAAKENDDKNAVQFFEMLRGIIKDVK